MLSRITRIIGISENQGTRGNINVQTIPGYSHKHCLRSNRKRGGSVSIYIKKSLSHKIRKQLALAGNEFESLVIEFDTNVFSIKKNIIVGIFYKVPTSSLKLFNQKLETNS